MKRSTFFTLASGAAVVAVGGALAYLRATRPPVINPAVPEPAKSVDIERYAGKWYELARHENRFEKGLDAVTADYALRPDGKVEVINSGVLGWPAGEFSFVEGRAIIVDDSNAKLKVSFFGPFYAGDYWILDHADDYGWSIVGEPSGRYLWVLSRTARPAPADFEALMQRVADLGYDRWALRITRQR
jgi:apolipoprotein D and lipocalin family protein